MEVEGVFGSRMTGGGFGGCTVTLASKVTLPTITIATHNSNSKSSSSSSKNNNNSNVPVTTAAVVQLAIASSTMKNASTAIAMLV